MSASHDDWREVLDRLLTGDRRAFVALDRLVTGVLVQLRAYDYRDEWDEVRQRVLHGLIENARAGRLADSRVVARYVEIATRQRTVGELKRSLRHAPVPPATRTPAAPGPEPEVWGAVHQLPEEERRAIHGVYAAGKTYQAVGEEIGIPIAAVTRRLRDAFASLRRRLVGAPGDDE